MLVHGLATRDERSHLIRLSRTGPWVPPISFPGAGALVLRARFAGQLEAAHLVKRLIFDPVILEKVVELHWNEWEDEPELYPISDNPDDYVLKGRHSHETLLQMPQLLELFLEPTAHGKMGPVQPGVRGLHLFADTWNGDHLFRAHESGENFVTPTGRDWFREHAAEYVDIEPVPVIHR